MANPEGGTRFTVTVAYALPDRQTLLDVEVVPGTSIQDAILQSGILRQVADLDLSQSRVGIYGKLKTLDTIVREHDRIEIYRPLIADPKEARRKRAARKAPAA